MKSGISKKDDKVFVRLSTQFVLMKPAFSPDTKHMFGFTIGQMVQGLALAQLATSAPHLHRPFGAAKVSAEDGGFVVEFFDDKESLFVEEEAREKALAQVSDIGKA